MENTISTLTRFPSPTRLALIDEYCYCLLLLPIVVAYCIHVTQGYICMPGDTCIPGDTFIPRDTCIPGDTWTFEASISRNHAFRVLHSRFPPFWFVSKPIWSTHMFFDVIMADSCQSHFSQHRFHESMPIVFSIVDFPPSGLN